MTYSDLVAANEARLRVEFIHIVDNNSLQEYYSVLTNLHCDFGIMPDLMSHYHGRKKSIYKKKINFYRKLTGRRFKLVRTANCSGYTRLVYSLV